MTQYTRRLTLAVPEAMMPQANQLALLMGESPDDVNTFTNANWQDASGNFYAICSAASKQVVVDALATGLPQGRSDVDYTLAQQAMDAIVVYEPGDGQAPADSIVLAIDHDPLPALAAMGLTRIEEDLV